jgi:predicted PurR-regulated permease PerM
MNNESQGVFTRERLLTVVLAILTFLALYLCYLIIEPFIPAIAFALALAVATQRPFQWLRRKFKSRTVSAAVAVVLVSLLIIGPAASLTTYIFQMAADHITELRKGGSVASIRQTLEQQPLVGPLIKQVGDRFRIEEQIGNIGQAIASRATGVLSGSVAVVTQLGITLFVLFFLYRDTGDAVQALRMPGRYRVYDPRRSAGGSLGRRDLSDGAGPGAGDVSGVGADCALPCFKWKRGKGDLSRCVGRACGGFRGQHSVPVPGG